MTRSIKSYVGFVIIVVAVASLAFVLGRWSGSLRAGLRAESEYPWDLQRRIGAAAIDCEHLQKPANGRFYVETLSAGDTLIVASFDAASQTVTASAIDASGRVATDSWTMDCT